MSISGDTDLLTTRLYRTILDTGAKARVISEKIVSEIGLISIGTSLSVPASGESTQCDKFRNKFGIAISDGSGAFMRTRDLDVLLGMDFLPTAQFTLYGGGFILILMQLL